MAEMQPLKVLIVGGNSFVARSIFYDLKEYHDVVSKTRIDLDCEDLGSLEKHLKEFKYDCVINCAANGGRRFSTDDQPILMANIRITDNLIRCKNKGFFDKLVVFGSGAEHYQTANRLFYSLSKKIQTKLCNGVGGILNLRLFGFFSHIESDRGFVDDVIVKAKNNLPIEIWEDKQFDYIFSRDLAKIILDYLSSKDYNYREIDCVYQDKFLLSDIAKYIVGKTASLSQIKVMAKSSIGYVGEKNWASDDCFGNVFAGIDAKIRNEIGK